MITARFPFSTRRSRSSAAPLRLLGLALILFGVLYTHAASPEGTLGHLAPSDSVSALSDGPTALAAAPQFASATCHLPDTELPGGHHGDHGQHHALQECALGQPPQGPGTGMPGPSTPNSTANDAAPHVGHGHVPVVRGPVLAPPAAASSVLRI
ncbi:hypothetical protein GCM10009654_19710 [Streptomyces hebeiensis]|uniref:Secreted protein n=1 Tax=Streptomyces hebeiensis TaxID=229486 RepID=A0ABN1USV4_9ACTN